MLKNLLLKHISRKTVKTLNWNRKIYIYIYIYISIYIYIYIYTLPRRVTINRNLCIFQYKLLHNILYLKEMLHKFGKKVSPHYSFCMAEAESPIHLFHSCRKTNFLWTQLQHSFQNILIIPLVTPYKGPSLDLLIIK